MKSWVAPPAIMVMPVTVCQVLSRFGTGLTCASAGEAKNKVAHPAMRHAALRRWRDRMHAPVCGSRVASPLRRYRAKKLRWRLRRDARAALRDTERGRGRGADDVAGRGAE